ncbi:Stp1/IreP family PP2C-type Ser/Thr phosphatase [Romboutsia hominis]|uniref:Protein phosphatase PrpC n=1 Tax=Romboutsia hominis TaxID=1507512 RepID=A0A2P2BTR9_9FIRM|nr:Stp1/IreP family PP2C-type Ser/Thr phosphatase [Romboutsia hominis]MCH1961007.1 Stp1/IreP family PP2C-type Ser/Thr phosphatase [Romboutsia hominis]MCH1968560.1 Stp1/IreP family PP2C-type Ser/Thr phosphatase [Romboutsia hominis]CEI73740.1 Protein phosphatase PrpC [Romboutsia hominis]
MIYSCDSDIGLVRKNNEDYCMGEIIKTDSADIGIFALADGMGGHKKGEVASKLAVDNIMFFLKENLLQNNNIKIDYIDDIIKQAYNEVNSIIYKKSISGEEYSGMGTTLTTAILYKNKLYVANVGDSRCYLLSKNEFKKVTMDHSVVEELIKANIITEEEAKNHPRRNHITRAMGSEEIVIVDIFKHEIDRGDKILLCSDGLTGFVDNESIEEIMMKDIEVKEISDDLINKANSMSGRDNISVIVIEDK